MRRQNFFSVQSLHATFVRSFIFCLFQFFRRNVLSLFHFYFIFYLSHLVPEFFIYFYLKKYKSLFTCFYSIEIVGYFWICVGEFHFTMPSNFFFLLSFRVRGRRILVSRLFVQVVKWFYCKIINLVLFFFFHSSYLLILLPFTHLHFTFLFNLACYSFFSAISRRLISGFLLFLFWNLNFGFKFCCVGD